MDQRSSSLIPYRDPHLHKIAQGGFAEVYSDGVEAVKILPWHTKTDKARIQWEFDCMRSMSSECGNVLPVFELRFQTDNTASLRMPLCLGSVASLLATSSQLPKHAFPAAKENYPACLPQVETTSEECPLEDDPPQRYPYRRAITTRTAGAGHRVEFQEMEMQDPGKFRRGALFGRSQSEKKMATSNSRKTKRTGLPEKMALQIFHQMVSATATCHSRGIIHGDLKPANFLLTVFPDSLHAAVPPESIKLTDFGLAYRTDEARDLRGPRGTEEYMAPEMSRWEGKEMEDFTFSWSQHFSAEDTESSEKSSLLSSDDASSTSTCSDKAPGTKADMFCLGVTLSEMLTGIPVQNPEDVKGRSWGRVSKETRKLVKELLSALPSERPSASELLSWLEKHPLMCLMGTGGREGGERRRSGQWDGHKFWKKPLFGKKKGVGLCEESSPGAVNAP